jgi:hypothetical protein
MDRAHNCLKNSYPELEIRKKWGKNPANRHKKIQILFLLPLLKHGRATKEGSRTGIPASTLWVSAAGKGPRTQQHMAQLNMSLV